MSQTAVAKGVAERVEKPVAAFTVQQPWAWAICFAGKSYENRPKLHPWESLIGQPVLIHAGMSEEWDTPEARADILRISGKEVPLLDQLRRGAVVAVGRVVDVRPAVQFQNPWAVGPWAMRLASVFRLERPIDVRGKQGVWYMEFAALTKEAQGLVRGMRTA